MSAPRHRLKFMSFRVNEDEAQRIEERARECGLARSRFLREAALGTKLRARPKALERRAIHPLARIGNNLNQLARHANGARRVELSRRLAEVLATVERAADRLS